MQAKGIAVIQRRKTPRPKALWKQIEDAKNLEASSQSPGGKESGSAVASRSRLRGYSKQRLMNGGIRWTLRQRSSKQSRIIRLYNSLRIDFMVQHPKCAVFPNKSSESIHHVRGRISTLLIDQRFWLATSLIGHRWIDEHRDEARKLGFLAERGDWLRIPDDDETKRLKELMR